MLDSMHAENGESREQEAGFLVGGDLGGEINPELQNEDNEGRFESLPNSMTGAVHELHPDHGLASDQNLQRLTAETKEIQAAPLGSAAEVDSSQSLLDRILVKAEALYGSQDFKACMEFLQETSKLMPGHPKVMELIEKTRRASEIRQAELEESDLASRVAQYKAEAVRLFELGQYSDCIQRFRVLSELEPTNVDLRHYFEISREQLEKQQIEAQPVATESAAEGVQDHPSIESTVDAGPAADQSEATWLEPQPCSEVHNRDDEHETPVSQEQAQSISSSSSPIEEEDQVALRFQETADERDRESTGSQPERKHLVQDTAGELSGSSGDLVRPQAKGLTLVYLMGLGLVIGSVVGAWLALNPARRSSTPPMRISSESSTMGTSASPTPIDTSAIQVDDLQTSASKSFKQGRLLEANRLCESILQKDPENRFALDTKQQIRSRFSRIAGQAAAGQRWEDARIAWTNVLKVIPKDEEALRQLGLVHEKLKEQESDNLARQLESEKKLQDLHQKILRAIGANVYLPPTSGNALELIQELEGVSPDDPFAREKLDLIRRNLTAQAIRALQGKDTERAATLVKQIETYFDDTSEVKAIREGIKAEESRLAEIRNSWMQKAEAAEASGRLVTPGSDNAVAYCNQVLALDSKNAKAIELKKQSVSKAAAQAKALTESGKFDEARGIYSSLLYLSQIEPQMSLSRQDLKAEIEKVTFSAYPVIHDHAIGSCTGRLRFNGYQISFVPSTDSKDGFVQKISEVSEVELGDKLKINIKGKTYRFQANVSTSQAESKSKTTEMREKLVALITPAQ